MTAEERWEKRITALEEQVIDIRRLVALSGPRRRGNWLGALLGRFKNQPGYDEVVRLGREFRETGTVESDPTTDMPPAQS